MRLLAGYLAPDAGSARLAGFDVLRAVLARRFSSRIGWWCSRTGRHAKAMLSATS
jgi:ABC-type multidrug transport system ATPase subunit